MCFSIFFFLVSSSDCEPLGRLGKESFSDQTLMEILVGGFNAADAFREHDGTFHEISRWYGVSLNGAGRVDEIDWEYEDDSFGLYVGRPVTPGGSIDLRWIPSDTRCFDITNLDLKGSINTLALPRSLEQLSCLENKFAGSFVTESLPQSLVRLIISYNYLSGTLNFAGFPSRLNFCGLSSNQFNGTVDLSCLPKCMISIYLYSNRFSGNVDLSMLPNQLREIEIHDNMLSNRGRYIGNLPTSLRYIKADKEFFAFTVWADSGEPPSMVSQQGFTTLRLTVPGR